MSTYITADDALAILQGRGLLFSRQLLRHYCNTGRAPEGTLHHGRNWLFTAEGVARWNPPKLKAGRKKNIIKQVN